MDLFTMSDWKDKGSTMAIIVKNGIEGKKCSTCHERKVLNEFPTDPTHGPLQGGRHCRCKECHRAKAKMRGRKKS